MNETTLKKTFGCKKPRMIAVQLMGDLFNERVPDDYILKVVQNMYPLHTYIILTKHPKRMAAWFGQWNRTVPPYIWPGVSAENQARWDERVPILRSIPAAKHIVSVEPMLGPIDCGDDFWESGNRLDWLIVGAEQGPGARHMNPDWATELANQCSAAEIPFFFKKQSRDSEITLELPRQFPAGYLEDA
jgi:protein gp37